MRATTRSISNVSRHPGRHDVGVVAARHRGERAGLIDLRLEQRVAVEPETNHRLATERGRQAPEGFLALVDDRDGVAAEFEGPGQLASDPAASHDHDMHAVSPAFNDVAAS